MLVKHTVLYSRHARMLQNTRYYIAGALSGGGNMATGAGLKVCNCQQKQVSGGRQKLCW